SLETELAHLTDPVSRRLHTLVQQTGHLLTPLVAPNGLAATLACRLRDDPDLAAIAGPLEAHIPGRYLQHRGPLPDRPHPALRRVLTGHTDGVTSVEIAPDGTWLATAASGPGSRDRTVRISDTHTGNCRATLTSHTPLPPPCPPLPSPHPVTPPRRPRPPRSRQPPPQQGPPGTPLRPPPPHTPPNPNRPHQRCHQHGDRPRRHLAHHNQRRGS